MANAYLRAEQLRRQQTSDDFWLLGAYMHNAVAVVVSNALRDKKKGQKVQHYVEEPIRVIPYTKEEQEARAERERQRVIDFFDRMAENDKKKHSRKE